VLKLSSRYLIPVTVDKHHFFVIHEKSLAQIKQFLQIFIVGIIQYPGNAIAGIARVRAPKPGKNGNVVGKVSFGIEVIK